MQLSAKVRPGARKLYPSTLYRACSQMRPVRTRQLRAFHRLTPPEGLSGAGDGLQNSSIKIPPRYSVGGDIKVYIALQRPSPTQCAAAKESFVTCAVGLSPNIRDHKKSHRLLRSLHTGH